MDSFKKYPHTAEHIFFLYGEDDRFKKGILQFGDGIVPVVDYFLQNEITSLTVQSTLADIKNKVTSLIEQLTIANLFNLVPIIEDVLFSIDNSIIPQLTSLDRVQKH